MPFLNKRGEIDISKRNLTHWRQSGVSYYVTFRLADSLPQETLHAWRTERELFLQQNPFPHSPDVSEIFHTRFTQKMEDWLDAGKGACLLNQKVNSGIVSDAIQHFHGKRYALGEWVAMPNHVHLVVQPNSGFDLSKILHSWKSYTSTKINRLTDNKGPLWQEESFNQILRNDQHLWRVEEYIRKKPTKAGISVHHASFLNQK